MQIFEIVLGIFRKNFWNICKCLQKHRLRGYLWPFRVFKRDAGRSFTLIVNAFRSCFRALFEGFVPT